MAAPTIITELVERFERNRPSYQATVYNETQLRREFLDPFFKALGWDVDNERGHAEAYKDVIHEDAIKVGGATKAPDYCFRIGGRRIFFLEAKKPSVNLRDDVSAAFQLRRYAWSAKLPLSILSDFEELAVYDCRVKPDKLDKPSVGRVLFFSYGEYLDRWQELADIFSREAVLRGSFDKFAESTKLKRGTAEVDTAFLEEIESWRESLAKNFALRNDIGQRDVNFAVQRTIDRLIFLRMCEDRGIETYGQLMTLLNGEAAYRRLLEVYDRADERYNSGLFHFHAERGRAEPPDELTMRLALDDKPLKEIVRGLYYPDSPYEFSVLPAEILGQVYEQFLGKVIRLTAGGHRAVVEDKPEVKKAGGVFYTPAYIVDYIVRETVGKLVERKTPKQVSKLRVLDPACGSGSFLVGAFQFLLDWHRDWYVDDGTEKHTKEIFQGPGGQWLLTTAEKKRILLNNIFGVDIDSQAVEVTKLSLLLKVLERENRETLERQLRLLRERALPDLGNNIKCGNSLIGPDFYRQRQMTLLDEEEQYRLNPFDWNAEFREILRGKDGGFDAVIGNPPYVNAWELFEATPHVRDYINASGVFETATRHWDLYVLFLEKALSLLRPGGRVSFIIPFSFAIQKYAELSRKLLLERFTIESIADLRQVRVFEQVPVITIIPVVEAGPPSARHRIEVRRPGPNATRRHAGTISRSHSVPQKVLLAQDERMLRLDISDATLAVCGKVEALSRPVGDICLVNYGAQMSSRKKGKFGKAYVQRRSAMTDTCRKTISGRNLYRYSTRWEGNYVEWALAPEMYGAREEWFFESPKLMIRDITGTHRLELAVDFSGLYCDHTILCGLRYCDVAPFREVPKSAREASATYSLYLLQGLLASRLISAYYYWKLTGEGVRIGGGFHTYPKTIRQLPIIDISRLSARQNPMLVQIGSLSERMATLESQRLKARVPNEKTRLTREIDATDRQIDDLVFELYGLTPTEVALVHAATERTGGLDREADADD
ncbi:MAG TPA: N-6 DNA methylase [Pirellulales bacterium]|nr:N-6 DNA methylase [Pirellulales bacterium]